MVKILTGSYLFDLNHYHSLLLLPDNLPSTSKNIWKMIAVCLDCF